MPGYKYDLVITRKDGTSYFYKSDVPPYEDTWVDKPLCHLLWSWHYTYRGILLAYGLVDKR